MEGVQNISRIDTLRNPATIEGKHHTLLSGTNQLAVVINAIFYVQKTPDRPHTLHNSAKLNIFLVLLT